MRSIDATLHRAALIIIAASLLGPGWVFVDAAVRHPEPWTDAATWAAGYRWFMAVPPLLGFPLLYGFVLFVAGARRLDEQRGGRVDPVPVLLLTWLVAPTFREERAVALLLRTNGIVSVACAAVALFDITWVQRSIGLAFYAAWNLLVVVLMVLVARYFRSVPGGGPTASPEATLVAGPGPGGGP